MVQKSLDGMKTSLHNAKLWGAETVLLVPGVVNPDTRYHGRLEALAKEHSHADPAGAKN